jgi:hypothetical protein
VCADRKIMNAIIYVLRIGIPWQGHARTSRRLRLMELSAAPFARPCGQGGYGNAQRSHLMKDEMVLGRHPDRVTISVSGQSYCLEVPAARRRSQEQRSRRLWRTSYESTAMVRNVASYRKALPGTGKYAEDTGCAYSFSCFSTWRLRFIDKAYRMIDRRDKV